MVIRPHAAGDTKHMAGQELLGAAKVGICGVGIAIAGIDEDVGCGD
jgi:hypothetical protein